MISRDFSIKFLLIFAAAIRVRFATKILGGMAVKKDTKTAGYAVRIWRLNVIFHLYSVQFVLLLWDLVFMS